MMMFRAAVAVVFALFLLGTCATDIEATASPAVRARADPAAKYGLRQFVPLSNRVEHGSLLVAHGSNIYVYTLTAPSTSRVVTIMAKTRSSKHLVHLSASFSQDFERAANVWVTKDGTNVELHVEREAGQDWEGRALFLRIEPAAKCASLNGIVSVVATESSTHLRSPSKPRKTNLIRQSLRQARLEEHCDDIESMEAADLGKKQLVDAFEAKATAKAKRLAAVDSAQHAKNLHMQQLESQNKGTEPNHGFALQDNTQLYANNPVFGQVSGRGIVWYTFDMTERNCNLTFTVSSIDGDPDLYISHYTQTPGPSPHSYEYASRYIGSDSITIINAKDTQWFAGVYAYIFNATWNIEATVECAAAPLAELENGVPQSGHISDRGAYRFYSFDVPEGATGVRLNLAALSGDPDLFCSPASLREYPKFGNATWSSRFYGSDAIRISSSDPSFCQSCTLYIGVQCYNSNCSYGLTATLAGSFSVLQDGVPTDGHVDRAAYVYYSFSLEAPSALTISIQAQTGDPDVFISTTSRHPSRTSYNWRGISIGHDAVTIPIGDPNYCVSCEYYIAVYGYTESSFTIAATADTPDILQSGSPFTSHADRGAIKYFVLYTFGLEDVTISVEAEEGEASFYVSEYGLPNPNNASSFEYYSAWYMGQPAIEIPAANQTGWGVFYVAVLGVTATDFTIVGSEGSSDDVLFAGVPIHVELEMHEYAYFTFQNDVADQTVTFRVTTVHGDPDLFVNAPDSPFDTPDRPNRTNYDYHSQAFGNDFVSLVGSESVVGEYSIAVYGFLQSEFTIVVELGDSGNDTIIQLYDGISQEDYIGGSGQYKYYMFETDSSGYFTLVIDELYGSVDAYIGSNADNLPSQTNFEFRTTDDFVEVSNAHASTTYFVAVRSSSPVAYFVTVSLSPTIWTLFDSVPIYGYIAEAHKYHYYQFFNWLNLDVLFEVTRLTGDPDIYVSTTNNQPSITNHTWASLSVRNETIDVTNTSSNFCYFCTYYISIYSFTPNSSYTLVAHSHDDVLLEHGEPQEGFVSSGAYTFYRFLSHEGVSDIKISLVASSGTATIYASMSSHPTVSRHTWVSTPGSTTGVANLEIQQTTASCTVNPDCTYFIAVYGNSDAAYQITAGKR